VVAMLVLVAVPVIVVTGCCWLLTG
jgi:hypothetical protein